MDVDLPQSFGFETGDPGNLQQTIQCNNGSHYQLAEVLGIDVEQSSQMTVSQKTTSNRVSPEKREPLTFALIEPGLVPFVFLLRFPS